MLWSRGKSLIGDPNSQVLLKVRYSNLQFGVWALWSRTWPSGYLPWFRTLPVTGSWPVWTQLISTLTRFSHHEFFSYVTLEFVSLCLQSIGPKPSLWALNKEVSFPVQHFKCWKCSSPGSSLWRIWSPQWLTIFPGSCSLTMCVLSPNSALTYLHTF